MSEGPAPRTLPVDEDLLRALLDGTFEGVLIHDDVIHYANARAAAITGRPVEALVGLPVAELSRRTTPDPSPTKPGPGAHYGPVEFTGVGPDGKSGGTIEAQGRAIELRGRWLWLSAFRDITPHKAAQLRLLNRLEFEDLITSICADLIHLEHDQVQPGIDDALMRIGRFARVDRSYVYMIDGDLMRASNVWTHELEPEKRRAFRDWTTPIGDFAWAIDKLRNDEVVVYTVREPFRFSKDGKPQPLPEGQPRSSCCVPMIVKGDLLGYLGFDAISDTHDWDEDATRLLRTVGYILAQLLHRKQAQDELARAYASMEATVRQRTDELEQQHLHLLHAEKMAALGQLVAGVAHEINTPLGAIKSNTDTLLRTLNRLQQSVTATEAGEEGSNPKQFRRLLSASLQVNEINVQAIDRITGIVNSLRKFARLDRAESDLVDLHEAIETTLTLVRHEFKHRIKVHRDFGELPLVECFPDQMNQVFMNLLVNAGQAIDHKGEVHIVTRASQDQVTLAFRDSGRGIPEADQQHVFDPGFTTKGVGVGTGLGLSIVQRILDEHHGRIEVESAVGEGSTFRLILPIRQPERADPG
ncbi:MAG: ATP-binding protein [Myxococcales bacterium]|nr:ATP-binding protein [Myxococcales bacterium]